MITKKKLSKRITDLQVELRELHRGYSILLEDRSRFSADIRQRFTDELARFKAGTERAQTDFIKFGVLEEWIKEVFELNNLKFSQQDFVEKSQEQKLREQIAQEIEDAVIEVAGNSAETMAQAARIARGR
jgi:hypothetical protein